MNTVGLDGYVPIRVYGQAQPFAVDWCYLGNERFEESFFDQTIQRQLRLPFNQLFRPQTTLEDLRERQTDRPGVPPAGFIFHMSRCGSTLLAQMLAALPQHIVISEAGPIDTVLQTHFRDPAVSDDQRVAWLRALIAALGQPRAGAETKLFIKFDAWHTLFLPIIQQAFPEVRWVFLYRDPVEVLVSLSNERGGQALPGVLPPGLLGLTHEMLSTLSLDEYAARALAGICGAAWANRNACGRFIAYDQLPEAGWTHIAQHFDLTLTAQEVVMMQGAAQWDAKSPALEFTPDGVTKQHAATPALRQLAGQWLEPLMVQLAATRRKEEMIA